MIRIKVCWKHKKYYPISTDNYESMKRLRIFEKNHRGCSVQVANLDELEPKRTFDPQYQHEIITVD